MAITNFYMQSGGSDLNAGSTTSNGAVYTSTSGTWNGTSTFTPTDGSTPASTVNVGDWASIYPNANTTTPYVAQVTIVGAGVNGVITLSTTAKYGTVPASGTGTRTIKTGGAWASPTVLTSSGIGGTAVPASTKVNIKQATYTRAASDSIGLNGSATAIFWMSGYNTTPGDLDNDTTNALAKPVFAYNANFTCTISGGRNLVTGLSFTGAVSNFVLTMTGATLATIMRCRVENTSSNSAAFAASFVGGTKVLYCWFKAPSTATANGTVSVGGVSQAWYVGCVAEGGGKAAWNVTGTGPFTFVNCVAQSPTGNGWLMSTQSVMLFGCTVANSTGDAVKWTGTPGVLSCVIGGMLSSVTGIGINNASGTNTDLIVRACDDFYACSTSDEAGMGDNPAFFQQDESSNPLQSTTDLSVIAGVNARAHGFPGIFENEIYSSYLTCGAVDPQTGSGTGFSTAQTFLGGF